jgi:hypothetical protein
MFLIKFEPTLFAARYRDAILPRNVTALSHPRRNIFERFKLKCFFDCQSNENAPTVFVDMISSWKLVRWKRHRCLVH